MRVRVRVKYGQYSFVLFFLDIVVAVDIDVRTFFLSYFILLTELAVVCVYSIYIFLNATYFFF